MTPTRPVHAGPRTLLDEELAVLAPGAGPLPWLTALPPAQQDAVLQSAARSLHVRGRLADGRGERPTAGEDDALLAALVVPARRVELVVVAEDAPADLLVLRPLPSGAVLLHATSLDGVHVLALLDRPAAVEHLRAALDPLATVDGDAVGRGAVGGGGALVRVRVLGEDGRSSDEQVCVASEGALGRAAPGPDGATPGAVAPLDQDALLAWAEELLGPPGAARPSEAG